MRRLKHGGSIEEPHTVDQPPATAESRLSYRKLKAKIVNLPGNLSQTGALNRKVSIYIIHCKCWEYGVKPPKSCIYTTRFAMLFADHKQLPVEVTSQERFNVKSPGC